METVLILTCLFYLKIIHFKWKYKDLPFGKSGMSLNEWRFYKPTMKDPYRYERYRKQYKRFF